MKSKSKLIEIVKRLLRESSRNEKDAEGLILSGAVTVGDDIVNKTGILVNDDEVVRIAGSGYVSRSAWKLKGAFEDNPGLSPEGKVCLDIGASTGGFSQILLEKNARKVYALDVGYGLLDFKIRSDSRVVPLDRSNIRQIDASWFSAKDLEEEWFIASDVSFMSSKTVLLSLLEFLRVNELEMQGVFLIKPQFETSQETEKGILPIEKGLAIAHQIKDWAKTQGFEIINLTGAKIKGRKGNLEYCLAIGYPAKI